MGGDQRTSACKERHVAGADSQGARAVCGLGALDLWVRGSLGKARVGPDAKDDAVWVRRARARRACDVAFWRNFNLTATV
jgi:hypothetical protein